MDEKSYEDKLNQLEMELNSYKKRIDALEEEFTQKFNLQNKILNSQNEIFNVLFCESDLKAHGHLRDIQLQTFEILRFVVKVCEDNDLDYWLDYGSLIGGVRHKGFVPWDDEADICMPRPDYEKFLKLISSKINEIPKLKENLRVSMGVSSFRNMNNTDSPSLACQIIWSTPLANVDIHPIDFYEITEDNEDELLKNNSKVLIVNAKRRLYDKVQNGTYESFNEGYLNEAASIGVAFNKTNYLGSSIDGTGRKPINTKYIYPLKEVTFEGQTFKIPNDPEEYLSKYYSGDIMKIPPAIQNHSRTDYVKARIPKDEIKGKYDQVISFLRYVNSNY